MDIRRKIAVLRALADDPRTPEAERRAAAAAVAAWEARLADEAEAPAPSPAPSARARALPAGPTGIVVLVLDRDATTVNERSTAIARRGPRGSRHVLSVVEVSPAGEKRVLGRWSITMRLEWPETPGDYLGFFGESGRQATPGERVAEMTIEVPDDRVLRRMFDKSQVMSLFVETGERGMIYFGRSFIQSFEEMEWITSRISLVALDEATQIADLGPDLPGAQRALAESADRQTLPAKAPLLALHEPGPDEDT